MLSLIAFAAACSSGDTKTDTNGNGDTPWLNSNCSEDCNGNLAGVTDGSCAEYNSNLYESGTITCTDACLADTSNCVEAPVPKAQEFSTCTGGPGPGNCDEGLECVSFDGTTSYCVRPCQGEDDTTTCGENTCIEFTSSGYCLQATAQRDTACLDNLKWCAEGAGECMPTGYDYDAQTGKDYRCKVRCDLGEENTCAGGESCLPDPVGFGEVQATAPDCVDDTTCDPGFSCTDLGGASNQCFRRYGLCGNPVANCMFDIADLTADTPSGEVQNWFTSTAQQCIGTDGERTVSDAVGHAYCNEITPADADANAAFSMCVDLQGVGLCIAFCEGTTGDLDCGEGYACERPAQALLYLDLAEDETSADGYVACETDDDCSAVQDGDAVPYTCLELTSGKKCSRALKQCVQNASVDPSTDDTTDTTDDSTDDSTDGTDDSTDGTDDSTDTDGDTDAG